MILNQKTGRVHDSDCEMKQEMLDYGYGMVITPEDYEVSIWEPAPCLKDEEGQ